MFIKSCCFRISLISLGIKDLFFLMLSIGIKYWVTTKLYLWFSYNHSFCDTSVSRAMLVSVHIGLSLCIRSADFNGDVCICLACVSYWNVIHILPWLISICVLYSSYSLWYHDINDMYMYIWYCVFKFCEINDVYIVFPIYYRPRRIPQCKLLVLGRYFTKRVALFPGTFSRWQLLTMYNCYT